MIEKAHPWDAGWDLTTPHRAAVRHGDISEVSTGITADIPQGHVGLILEKSGLARKGLQILGGVIDAGYTGEIVVMMTKVTSGEFHLFEPGDKVAQLVVVPLSSYAPASLSGRGAAGFGSSGR